MRIRGELWACLAILAVGCVSETESARLNLGSCPAGVRPGMPCDASFDVSCAVDGLLCWCDASPGGEARIVCEEGGGSTEPPICSADGILACYRGGDMRDCRLENGELCRCTADDANRPIVECAPPAPPPPPPACTVDHVDRCVAGERTECQYPSGRVCGCYPTDRGAEIFCVDPPTEPPPGCDENALRRCLNGEPIECRYDDGRVCGCYVSSDGTVAFRCDGPPPPDPNLCTPEDYQRCLNGERIECIRDGASCYCEPQPGSTEPRIVCTTPPSPPACTDADLRRCEAGERVECVFADGRICSCGDATVPPGSTGFGFTCSPPPPTDTCTDELLYLCQRGERVECTRDGVRCYCGGSGVGDPSTGFVCDGSQPPGGTHECTNEDAQRCLDGNADVSCTSSGTVCTCGPGGRLTCTSPPVPEPGADACTDESLRACEAGQDVRCTNASGQTCVCSPDSTTGLICG